MARLYLIRHGKPTKSWDEDPDPPLDPTGEEQARAVAEKIAPLGPMAVWSSPMRRCRETAGFTAKRWRTHLRIVPEMTEIPSPVAQERGARAAWLRKVLAMRWQDFLADPELIGSVDFNAWRNDLVQTLLSAKEDCAIFTHFVAINAALGRAHHDDRLISRLPNHCSLWVFDTEGERLALHQAGEEIEGARAPIAERQADVR